MLRAFIHHHSGMFAAPLGTYLYRYLAWNAVNFDDYQRFPSIRIQRAGTPLYFAREDNHWEIDTVLYTYKGQKVDAQLIPFLERTGTTALIVIKDNRIQFEGYFNGYSNASINTSFSVAKSITSLLVGIALAEKAISSPDDPVSKYLPHAPVHYKDITIRHLLNMQSGLSYQEGPFPWMDDPWIYYGVNLRKQAFQARRIEQPGDAYHYNNYNLLLLGLILEQTTGTSPAIYLQEKIWKYLGAEQDASWSVDSKHSMFAKMESGFNAIAMDFARLAWLCLNKGYLNNRQLIPQNWLEQTFQPPVTSADTIKYRNKTVPPLCKWISSPNGFYHNLWWGYKIDPQAYDSFALGVMWQLIYLAPRKNTIIVRFGTKWGHVDWWPAILKFLVDSL